MRKSAPMTQEELLEENIILKEKKKSLIKTVIILSLILAVLFAGSVFSAYKFIRFYMDVKTTISGNQQKITDQTDKINNIDILIEEKDNKIDSITKERDELKEENEYLKYRVKKLTENTNGEETL